MKRITIKFFFTALLILISVVAMGAVFSPECALTFTVPETLANTDLSGVITAFALPVAAVMAKVDLSNLKISQSDFDALKAKHGKLYVIDVKIDEDESYQFIAKRPTRVLLSAIADSKDDLDKANELIITNMVVAGDTEYLSDGIVYAGLMKQLGEIMKQGNGFLSKA